MTNNTEFDLLRDILDGYDVRIRPVRNRSEPINLHVEFSLLAILDLDEKNQVFNTKGYLSYIWTDEFLQWNSTEYSDIELVMVHASDVWRPDIGLYNSVNGFELAYNPDSKIGVFSDGTSHWAAGSDFSTLCNISVSQYPFDTQTCRLKFGPWFSFPSMQLSTATYDKIRFSFYRENTEWKYIRSEFVCYIHGISICDIDITIQRRSTHHVMNLVLPVILLTLMNPVTFLIPCASGERLSFGMSLFLSYSVLMTSIIDTLPIAFNETCYFTMFVQVMFWFGGLQCCISAVVSRMASRPPGYPVPEWVTKIVSKIPGEISQRNQEKDIADSESKCSNDVRTEPDVVSWSDVMLQLDFCLYILFNVVTILFIIIVLSLIVP